MHFGWVSRPVTGRVQDDPGCHQKQQQDPQQQTFALGETAAHEQNHCQCDDYNRPNDEGELIQYSIQKSPST
jgi:hypothetical protein